MSQVPRKTKAKSAERWVKGGKPWQHQGLFQRRGLHQAEAQDADVPLPHEASAVANAERPWLGSPAPLVLVSTFLWLALLL